MPDDIVPCIFWRDSHVSLFSMQNAGPAPAPLSQMGPGGPPDGIGPGGPGMPPGFFPVSLDQMVIQSQQWFHFTVR